MAPYRRRLTSTIFATTPRAATSNISGSLLGCRTHATVRARRWLPLVEFVMSTGTETDGVFAYLRTGRTCISVRTPPSLRRRQLRSVNVLDFSVISRVRDSSIYLNAGANDTGLFYVVFRKEVFRVSKFADRQFWVDTADRAVASFAQALVTTGVFESVGLLGVDWTGVLSLSGGYALASVLTSIAFRGGANRDNTVDGPGV